MFKKFIFDNKLKLLTIPHFGSQTVTVLVLIKTGSKYEEKDKNGISHFLEHMFFKGTKKRPSLREVAEVLDKVGGTYNAFTSEDLTGFFAKVKKNHFELALEWVADILLNPILPSAEVDKERGVIMEEIKMYYDNPITYAQILWPKLLYGDQPAGWPIAGTSHTIRNISREDLFQYRNQQYVGKNTIVILAGEFDEKGAKRLVKKYFLKLKAGKPKRKSPVKENQKKPNLLLHFRETQQTHLCLGVRAFNIFHPQKYALEVLGTILGGMFSSRLSVLFRDKLGIAYYIHTDIETNPDTGFLVTLAGVDAKNVELAIKTILKEYKNVLDQISSEEIQKAKEFLKGRLILSLETSDSLASFFGVQEALKGFILTPNEICEEIEKVTEKELKMVAKEIFRPEKLNLVVVGPFKNKAFFEKILKI